MAVEDAKIQGLLLWFAGPLMVIAVLYYLRKKYWLIIQDIMFQLIWVRLMGGYHSSVYALKKRYFASIHDVQSVDIHLYNRGLIRILEIGARSGNNLEFYPPNSLLSVTEPNIYFEPLFYKKLREHPDINFQKYYVASADDMSEIHGNSFDIVVSFMVLCSVKSVTRAVQEVRRVLAPGGKFYYWEHVHDRPGTWLRIIQNVFTWTLWPALHGNCHLNRYTDYTIENAGFDEVEHDRVEISAAPLFRAHIIGVATK